MPLYSYKCEKCGKIEEAFRRIDDREKNLMVPHQNGTGIRSGENNDCSGIMVFQPIQTTTFKMNPFRNED